VVYNTAQFSKVQYSTVKYSTLQQSTVQYSSLLEIPFSFFPFLGFHFLQEMKTPVARSCWADSEEAKAVYWKRARGGARGGQGGGQEGGQGGGPMALQVIIMKWNQPQTRDYRQNRVRVIVNKEGKVRAGPFCRVVQKEYYSRIVLYCAELYVLLSKASCLSALERQHLSVPAKLVAGEASPLKLKPHSTCHIHYAILFLMKQEDPNLDPLPMMQPPEKSQWPELVGKTGEEAKAAILAEFPKLNIFTLLPNQPATMDYRLE